MKRNRVFLMVLSMILTTLGFQTTTAVAAAPVFRAASSSNANTPSPSVDIPAAVQAGDQLVMVVSVNTDTPITTPAGWNLLGFEQDGRPGGAPNMGSAVFATTADATIAGSTVDIAIGRRSKTAITVTAYGDAQPATAATATTLDANSNSLTTAPTTVGQDDTVVISYWVDKTSGNTGWTAPAEVTTRATSIGSSGGRVTSLMADRVVDAGVASGVTATSAAAGTKGISWTITLDPTIVNEAPTAAFTANCVDLTCDFDGSASAEPNGAIDRYDWNFGDGATGDDAGPTPSHTYAVADDYDVTLTVTDDDGETDTVIISVTVTDPPNQLPTAAFTYDCTELSCTFDGSTSSDDDPIASFDWDFGDGTILLDGGPTPAHAFGAAGDSTVTLTVTDADGETDSASELVSVFVNEAPTAAFTPTCVDLTCDFDANASFEPNGSIASYDWDYGDGTIELDFGATPSHEYATAGTFDVTLTVTDDDGETDSITIQVTTTEAPNVLPTAAFVADCDELTCSFDASTSSDDDPIVSYDWDYGDGTIELDAGVTPSHVYGVATDYTVTLTVTDADGETDSVAVVVSPSTNPGPIAAFTPTCTDLGCSFDASASSDDGTIESYAWDFGDGAAGTGVTVDHDFSPAGDYDVTLTVTDDDDATDSVTIQITATEPANQPPVASFTHECVDLSCTFDAAASNEPNGTIVTYDWDFGGAAAPDDGPTPEFTFLFGGDYDVELTVTDDDGETASVTVTVSPTAPAAYDGVLPPDIPRRNVPVISGGEITDLELIGNRIYIVGTFTSIRNNVGGNNNTVNQARVAAYDINTGLVDTTFNPTFDRGVTEITRSPDGSRLYVVGRFNNVNGISRRKIAAINPVNGDTITQFSANANSQATAVAATEDTVYVGGRFTTVRNVPRVSLAAVDAITGEIETSFVNNMSGGIGVDGALTVQALDLSEDGNTLLVVHTGRQINGLDRYGPALIDTQTNDLLPWRTRLWEDNLFRNGGIQRVYTGSIAPNGEYFVVGSGSGGDRPPISDTVVAFPIAGNDHVEPLWISRMFDSIYSLDVSDDAVYAGGHMNYAESQTAPDPWPGLDNVGYGRGQGLSGYGLGDDVVIRNHIVAIDPVYGKALEWNPGSNSFEGNKAMLWTDRGLFTGGDGNTQGGYNVGRVAFYDLASVAPPGQNESTILSPIEGRIERTEEPFVIGGTADSASGVQRVQIEVLDTSRNQYLQDDLTTWGGWNAIIVDLESPGATSTPWAQELMVEGNRAILVRSRAYGNNGSREAVKDLQRFETFGLSDETPTTRISGPGTVVPTLDFTVTGTANDDVGVVAVRMSIRDMTSGNYLQDNGTVASAYNTVSTDVDVIGAVDATWSYELTVPYEGEWRMEAIAVDTAGQADLRGSVRTWIVTSTGIRPAVAITSPVLVNPPFDEVYVVAPGSPLTLSGIATDDEGLRDVEIRIRNNTTDENLDRAGEWGIGLIRGWHRISPVNISGTSYNWTYTTPFTLDQGRYEFEIRATDDLGLTTTGTLEAELDVDVEIAGDSPPDARLDRTGNIYDVDVLQLVLTGTATDDIGVAQVLIELRDLDTGVYLQEDGTVGGTRDRWPTLLDDTDPTNVTWSITVDLPMEGDWYVQAYAIDTAGQLDLSQSGAIARYFVYPGDVPPEVTLLSPPAGTLFNDGRIQISGRVQDDRQIAGAQVAVQNSAGLYMTGSGAFTSAAPSWRNAFLTSPGSPGSNFEYTTPAIPDGDYTIYARGVDQRGAVTEVPRTTTATVTSPPNDPPVADFTYSCDENVCTFDARTSTDEDTSTLSYSWNFGNGGGSGALPVRTYTAAGTYSVVLTVTDFYGLTSEATQDVVIVTPAGNQAPTAVIAAASCTLLRCNFSSLGTEDPDTGDSLARLWDFGDGGTSTSQFPSRTFAEPGIYTVSLTATDGWGAFTTVSVVVDVSVPADNVAPTPVIEAPVCTLLSCDFSSANSSDGNAGDTFSVAWDFGGDGTSSAVAPTHVFSAAGTYTVTLTATDVWGAEASTTVDVTVTAA